MSYALFDLSKSNGSQLIRFSSAVGSSYKTWGAGSIRRNHGKSKTRRKIEDPSEGSGAEPRPPTISVHLTTKSGSILITGKKHNLNPLN
jgi:hypothetical protein